MTLTPEKLDELERLAELATPGPWEPNDKRPVGGHGFSLFAGSQYIGHVGDSDGKTPCEANANHIAALDPATVRELVRAAKERAHQAARIAELRYRVKRALSGDLYALLTDIQNGIDALGHKDMANSAIQRIDALLTILEGDEA